MNDQLFIKLQDFRASLNAAFLEREHIVDGLLATLLCKQNAFLLGAPGTGKSDLVRAICNGIEGADYFGYLLTPTSDPSEIFGPVAVSKLLADEYTRDVHGYLPSCHIAFLDELFRGSSAILNSLLTLLNERTFNNGKDTITTPIQSIISATNSWPEEESLQAFADRFIFRPEVQFLSGKASKSILDQWALGIQERPKVGVHLTLKELEELQQAVHGVDISENFLSDYSTLWELLSSNGIVISDRRRVQILKFLKAWTLVQGESQLCADHFHNSLVHMIYRNIEDQKTIREVIETQFPTAAKLLSDARRAADTIMTQFNVSSRKIEGASIESLNDYAKDLKRYHRDIQTIGSKVDELMDNPISKMPASVRMKGVKLQNILEEYKNKIAATLAELPG
jgi:MoxR-like ATPase